MPRALDPFQFVLVAVGGWMNQHQLQIIDLSEEKRFFANNSTGGDCDSTTLNAVDWPCEPKA